MRKTKKLSIIILLAIILCSCLVSSMVVFAMGKSVIGEVTASDLWSGNGVAAFENNKEIPDYAKYGLCYDHESSTYVYVNESSEDLLLEDWERYGLGCTMSNGTINFNNVVDISNFSKSDEILSFMITPTKQGVAEFGSLTFTLTDAEDENNYFSFSLLLVLNNRLAGWAIENPGVTATISNKSHTPIDVIYLYQNLKGQTYFHPNFESTELRNFYYRFSYDYTENALYTHNYKDETIKIFDFDDNASIGSGNEWEGFSSGKVRLSITAKDMQVSAGNFIILGAFNQKMAGEKIADSDAPAIYVEEISKNAPIAQVGKAYRIFEACAYDVVDGKLPVRIKVRNTDGMYLDITDGTFLPGVAGDYIIEYYAEDTTGHQSLKSRTVTCKTQLDALTVNVSEEEDCSDSVFYLGNYISIPKFSVVGGSGYYSVTTKVTYREAGKEMNIVDNQFFPKLPGSYEIKFEVEDYIGNITTKSLIYNVEKGDKPILQGEIQKIKKLYCGVKFAIPLPQVYDYTDPMNGVSPAEYKITAIGSTGKSFVIEDGVFTPDESYGNAVTFEYEMYLTGREDNIETFSYTVPLIKNMMGAVSNLFAYNESAFDVTKNDASGAGFIQFDSKDDATAEDIAEGITYALALGEANIGMSFSILDYSQQENELITSEEYRKLGLYANYRYNYSKVRVEIRDSQDASIGFDYTLEHYLTVDAGHQYINDHRTMLRLNNQVAIIRNYLDFHMFSQVTGGFIPVYKQSSTPMKITYSDGALYDDGGNYLLTVEKGLDGKAFNGFPSHKAYMTIKFDDVAGKVGVKISTVGSTPMKTTYKNGTESFIDMTPPKIQLLSSLKLKYFVGDIVEIPNAYAYDDLSAEMGVYVTVKDPSGKIVNDFNKKPIVEGYTFRIESIGGYSVIYSAQDANGRPGTKTLTISALDSEAPTVVINSAKEIKVKAGASIDLPDAIVQDNVNEAEDLNLYIVLIDAAYKTKLIDDKSDMTEVTSFIAPTIAGRYKLRYVVVDSTYNLGYSEITLIVE